MTAHFRTGYFDDALFNLEDTVLKAAHDLKGVDCDTLVGTGMSGGIIVPTLALMLDKKWALLRKEHDDSHHGGGRFIGTVGKRWLFVDDFIQTGKTKGRVIRAVNEQIVSRETTTEYIGSYQYAMSTPLRLDDGEGYGYPSLYPMPTATRGGIQYGSFRETEKRMIDTLQAQARIERESSLIDSQSRVYMQTISMPDALRELLAIKYDAGIFQPTPDAMLEAIDRNLAAPKVDECKPNYRMDGGTK